MVMNEIHVKDEELAECTGKQICIRRQTMEKEVSVARSRNLYEILNLNMEEVCGKPFEEQSEIIKIAAKLRRWHSDRNPENVILQNAKRSSLRSRFLKISHVLRITSLILTKEDGSQKRDIKLYSSPNVRAQSRKKQYRAIIELLFSSVILIATGVVVLIYLTSGTAAVAIAVLGLTAASGALMGGTISNGLRTINLEAIEKGSSLRKYLASLAIGAVGGVEQPWE